MVSFSCERCGDILTKKKLDNHRNQCRNASFSCLDCMKEFSGIEYKGHTVEKSCISEAEKHQGALYTRTPNARRVSQSSKLQPSVEDAPDSYHDQNAIVIVEAPPPAPTPPPVNVFDFLNSDATPNASQVNISGPKSDALVRKPSNALIHTSLDSDSIYEKYGYSYGDGPVPVIDELNATPAPKKTRDRSRHDTDKKDKKRKRHHVDDLDLSLARQRQEDETMTDAPPVLHSGLTGGLNRLLSRPQFPPSPDFSGNDGGGEPSPGSPLKRSKRSTDRRQVLSLPSNGNTDTRKSSSSTNADERPRKHHRRHRRHRDGSERPALKAIEYPAREASQTQLVLYQSRAELFCSFISKGPESEKGCSLNKALKRYHRERVDKGVGLGRAEEEKALWKSLRLRRNANGEIVLFI